MYGSDYEQCAVEVPEQAGFKIKIANMYLSACAFIIFTFIISFGPANSPVACSQMLYFSVPTLQIRKLEHKWLTCSQSQS